MYFIVYRITSWLIVLINPYSICFILYKNWTKTHQFFSANARLKVTGFSCAGGGEGGNTQNLSLYLS